MILDGIELGGLLQAIAQFFEAGPGLVQLLFQLLAISQAVQLELGHFDIIDGLLGVLFNFRTALDQFLVQIVGLVATLFQLVLQAVELILHLIVGLAIETETCQEGIATVFLGAGGEVV